jgi:Ca2+-binding EF-hand superfamily protein
MKALNSLITTVFLFSPLLTIAQTPTTTDAGKASAPSRSFVVIDKNKDGHISREEAKQAGISSLNFDAADKDKDGKINLSEWTLLKF